MEKYRVIRARTLLYLQINMGNYWNSIATFITKDERDAQAYVDDINSSKSKQ